MPHPALLESQQASYIAAQIMDEGQSPRAASKIADISRRDTVALSERHGDGGLPLCTQQVLLEFLRAADAAGLPDDELTPESVSLSFPVAPPEHVISHLQYLRSQGYNSRGQLTRTPGQQGSLTPLWHSLPHHSHEQDDPDGPPALSTLRHLPLPGGRVPPEIPEDPLRAALLYHWLISGNFSFKGSARFLRSTQWPGRTSRIIEMLEEWAENTNLEYEDEIPMLLGPGAALLLPVITHNTTTRIAYQVSLPDPAAPAAPATPAPAWPQHAVMYAELTTPLPTPEGDVIHGMLIGPEFPELPPAHPDQPEDPDKPGEAPDPRPRITGIITENDTLLFVPTALTDFTTGLSVCALTTDHECGMDADFHHRFSAATAQALAKGLNPEPLTRQQRRRFQRVGWSHTWHTAAT